MRRRPLLRRVGAAGTAGAVGAIGTSAAETGESAQRAAARGMTIVWTAPDGATERLSPTAFDRRTDTPPFAEIAAADCCECTDCECRYPPCEVVEVE